MFVAILCVYMQTVPLLSLPTVAPPPRYSVVYDTSTRGTFDSELQRCELATAPDACEPRVCAVDPRLSLGGNTTECTLAAEDSEADDTCTVCLHAALGSEPGEDLLGFLALFLAGVMAGMSGIGGGGLNVPLLLLLMDWTVNEASVLSHVAVFGAAVAQNLFNLPRRHPLQPRRPLVEFELPLLLLPPQLCGNALGITLRPVFGSTMLEAVATVVLLAVLVKTWRRASAMWRDERAEKHARAHDEPLEAAASADTDTDTERQPRRSGGTAELLSLKVVGPSHGYSQFDADHGGSGVATGGGGDGSVVVDTATSAPPPALRTSLLLAGFSAVFTLANVTVQTVSGGSSCNATFWTLTLLIDGAVALLVADNLRRLLRLQRAREAAAQGESGGGGGATRVRGDLDYSSRMVLVLPAVAFLVGAISGLLGLGGGEMMAPLLLMLGLLPQVASATSAFMILFTSCSNVTYYVWHGELFWFQGYQWLVPTIAFFASLVGRTASVVVAARLSHPSVIVFALTLVLAVSIVLLVLKAALAEAAWGFGSLCG